MADELPLISTYCIYGIGTSMNSAEKETRIKALEKLMGDPSSDGGAGFDEELDHLLAKSSLPWDCQLTLEVGDFVVDVGGAGDDCF